MKRHANVRIVQQGGFWFVWSDGQPIPFPYPDLEQAEAAAKMLRVISPAREENHP